jgi:hypothetical protein
VKVELSNAPTDSSPTWVGTMGPQETNNRTHARLGDLPKAANVLASSRRARDARAEALCRPARLCGWPPC